MKLDKLERKCCQNGNTNINLFKITDDEDPFHCTGMGTRMKLSVVMLEPVKAMINMRNAREVTIKVKSGDVVQYVINGIMKTVFMSNVSHPAILDYFNRLYYLLITCYICG